MNVDLTQTEVSLLLVALDILKSTTNDCLEMSENEVETTNLQSDLLTKFILVIVRHANPSSKTTKYFYAAKNCVKVFAYPIPV